MLLTTSEIELLLGIITGYIEIEAEGRHKPDPAISATLLLIQNKIEVLTDIDPKIIDLNPVEIDVLSNVIKIFLNFESYAFIKIPAIGDSLRAIRAKLNEEIH